MNPDLHKELTRLLLQDYELKDKGAWLREGVCPECHKREVYANADAPWVVKCGRIDKCRWERHVKELYPDLFDNWSDRYQRTEANPHAAADAYLADARGLDVDKLKGRYTQETYVDRALDATTATVRFALPGDGYWERLIDKPGRFGKKKARFNYGANYKGRWWVPPGVDVAECEELWIVEGIFDACALALHGVHAVAALSCNNYPGTELEALGKARGIHRPKLVWALDTDGTNDDGAGQTYIRKWCKQARQKGWDCDAAQIPQESGRKVDWNDLHLLKRLEESHLKAYRYHGALLIARSAAAKALLIYGHDARSQFPFEFARCLWWFKLDLAKFDKAKQALESKDDGLSEEEVRDRALAECNAVQQICNGYPRMLYFQRNDITDESWYYFRVAQPTDRPAVKNTFTGAQIMAGAEFGKRLASMAAGCLFTGTTEQLQALLRDQIPQGGVKLVETIDFIGYAKEHGAYIFGDVAVKDGRTYELNAEDYFEIGRLNVKSLLQSLKLEINTTAKDYTSNWLTPLWTAFGVRGMVSLAFWLGSLFAEQIRARDKSFPFLEAVGEAGAGKTTLIEFLWKLVGREDFEGTDPTKSTLAGRTRTFGQVGNLPMVMIEADRSNGADKQHAKQFDWDELKPLYNGRIGRARGHKSAGNETYEPPFRGSVVISQNAVVDASDAVLQRIVHLHFDKSLHSADGAVASKQLENWPIEQVSGFVLQALRREKKILDLLAEYTPSYEAMLKGHPNLKSMRICKNHAQMMALVDALTLVVPITKDQLRDTHNAIIEMAVARQQAINADHPLVQEFWELFDYLDGEENGVPHLNHSRDDNLIAVSLPHFLSVATRNGITKVPAISDLKRLLPESRARKFVAYKSVNSRITVAEGQGVTVKCWVFRRDRAAPTND